MAYTLDDLDRIKAAIATGAKEVTFGSGETQRKMTYQSTTDMLRAKADIEAEVFGTSGLASRRTVAGYNSGL